MPGEPAGGYDREPPSGILIRQGPPGPESTCGPTPDSKEVFITPPRHPFAADREDRVRINHQIRLSPVRLVGPDGSQIGIVPIEEARARAEELGLDLVEMNPNVRPIVVRIMDYGRFKYDKQKREKKSKTAATELKQIKYRPNIDEHDFQTKTDKLRRFLSQGNKVRVTVMFRRRDMRRPENGLRVLHRVAEALSDLGRVEDMPTQVTSRDLTMTVLPLRQPAKKEGAEAGPSRRQERQAARQAKTDEGREGVEAETAAPAEAGETAPEPTAESSAE